jgi:hypothetical protein
MTKARKKVIKRRSSKDYAIEFGGYLAAAARRYMDAVNREIIPEGDEEVGEAWRALRSALYEFEKRVRRAAQ